MRSRIAVTVLCAALSFGGGSTAFASSKHHTTRHHSARSASTSTMQTVVTDAAGNVVWSGDCPTSVAEADIGSVDATCRDLGYRMQTGLVSGLRRLGGTTVTDRVDGGVRSTATLTADTLTRTIYPGRTAPGLKSVFSQTCDVDADGSVRDCTTNAR